ncbi:hypothetical protein FCV25MIE_14521 [Fagus crenata]
MVETPSPHTFSVFLSLSLTTSPTPTPPFSKNILNRTQKPITLLHSDLRHSPDPRMQRTQSLMTTCGASSRTLAHKNPGAVPLGRQEWPPFRSARGDDDKAH